ncbi:MAG: TRAFAC clade GTPase domain-containing protein, partial [Terriglobia bacterium]
MSKYSCPKSDCTVAVTSKCLLSHVPIETCPNVQSLGVDASQAELERRGEAVPMPLIYHGNELGFQQAGEVFAARYGHLIGVLGAHATGKTCLLCSLYLLASCGDLRPRQLFAGSVTLPGFESRLRLLRSWSEAVLPHKIVDHTLMADPRQPGLLHLALMQTAPIRRLRDLFFTDLPGEWTTTLIKRADVAERFLFLRRADGLIITLPAPQLLGPETRHSQIHSTRILLQRLRETVGIAHTVPIILAITRCDQTGPVVPPAVYQLVEFGRELGFPNISHVPVAAFSDRPDVPSGMGLGSVLDTILQTT